MDRKNNPVGGSGGGVGAEFAGRKLRDIKMKGASCPNLVALQAICYCSNFSLNDGDWMQAYEHMQQFVTNLQSNLGK